MINILFHVTVKNGKEEEFHNLAQQLTKTSRLEEGCLNYIFLQEQDNPREYVLFEQWLDERTLFAHLDNLVTLLGPCEGDEKLPAAFLNLCEKTRPFFYKLIS